MSSGATVSSRLADLVPRRFATPVWTWTYLADPLPPHTSADPHVRPEERNPLSGRRIRLILPPEPAADVALAGARFNCDTELVWAIHPASVQELTGRDAGRTLYVCEHQFKLD
jgi:hypothetical protein